MFRNLPPKKGWLRSQDGLGWLRAKAGWGWLRAVESYEGGLGSTGFEAESLVRNGWSSTLWLCKV